MLVLPQRSSRNARSEKVETQNLPPLTLEILRVTTEPAITRRKNADKVITRAQSDDNKQALRGQTEHAKALGIFGSPTFIIGDEVFWGDDRLEEAMEFRRDLVETL